MKPLTLNRLNTIIHFLIRLSLLVAIFVGAYSREWLTLFIAMLAFVLTFSPRVFEKKYKIDIPTELEILIIFFIYLSIYLGEVHNFYFKFWWWDVVLHGVSALSLGLIGFILVLYLYQEERVKVRPFLLCFFAFAFAVTFGTIWEIFEFSMDQTFGFNMQKSGLMDTMGDLIIDGVGALFGAIFGFIYLKNRHSKLTFLINSFVRDNPSLFGVRNEKTKN